MGPTRIRELAAAGACAVVLGFLTGLLAYRWFPPIGVWTGISLLLIAFAEGTWAWLVRAKIAAGQIGEGRGSLHPLTVASSVVAAKASAWAGALVSGWWIGLALYFVPRLSWQRTVQEDIPGVLVAAACALVLVVAALWLQYCCKSPSEPGDPSDA